MLDYWKLYDKALKEDKVYKTIKGGRLAYFNKGVFINCLKDLETIKN